MATSTAEETARYWYYRGSWKKKDLKKLVERGKLSPEAYEDITGEPYEE